MTEMIERAKEKAVIIAKDLSIKYPGRYVKKSTLRLKYELPMNQSVLIFQLLQRDYGFVNEHKFLKIPARVGVANVQQQKQS